LILVVVLSIPFSNPGYPTPVPSLAIPLSHKGDSSGGAHVPFSSSFAMPVSARALQFRATPLPALRVYRMLPLLRSPHIPGTLLSLP